MLGDFACPRGLEESLKEWVLPKADVICLNLEGGFASHPDDETPEDSGLRLYNSRDSIPILKAWGVDAVCLANNHILDSSDSPMPSIELLNNHGIECFGAGDSIVDAEKPLLLDDGNTQIVFLAFAWSVIGCIEATERHPGANPLSSDHVETSISKAREKYPSASIIVHMHWGFDLEIYPLPAQRRLADAAIKSGANLVIGHHPHCVQGIERFEAGTVAYSLGNWFLPSGGFFGDRIALPEFANEQLAITWTPSDDEVVCSWYEYNQSDFSISLRAIEPARSSARAVELTPFAGMEHDKYEKWFWRNRRRRNLLPVYNSFDRSLNNSMRNWWMLRRNTLISARSWLRRQFD